MDSTKHLWTRADGCWTCSACGAVAWTADVLAYQHSEGCRDLPGDGDVLAIADQILEEMRGGPLLAVGPERSRQILAPWIVRMVKPDAEEIRVAVLAEREACIAAAQSAEADDLAGLRTSIIDAIRARK